MKYFPLITSIIASLCLAGELSPSLSECSASCPMDHHDHESPSLPIGIMGGHLHQPGEWMVSYRYMFMNMEQNYSGRNTLTPTDLFSEGYMVSPIDMQMEMHMLGLMYGLTEEITLTAMTHLLELEMLHLSRNGATFSTRSQGLGDSSIGALFKLLEKDQHHLHAGLSLLLPTAETDQKDFIPAAGRETILPYPMQLGAGSWGLKPSLTYTGQHASFSWGAQAQGQIHLSDNNDGYQLGDSLTSNLWTSYQLTEKISTSLRLQSSSWGNIDGHHQSLSLMPSMVPTADPHLRGGHKADLYWGLSLRTSSYRLSAEIGKTLWQDLDGPQLGSDWSLILGLQGVF